MSVNLKLSGFIIDIQRTGTGHANLTHLAGYQCGMGGHSSAGGENSFCRIHTLDILGTGFNPGQNDLFPTLPPIHCIRGVKNHLSRSGAGTGVQSLGQQFTGFNRRIFLIEIEYRTKQLVQLNRFYPHERGLFINKAFLHHIHGNPESGKTGSFSCTGLKEPQPAILNGEFHILHFFIMLFQLAENYAKLFINFGHNVIQFL